MIQMQKFYSKLNQPTETIGESYRHLQQIQKADLEKILIIRSQLAWEEWTQA